MLVLKSKYKELQRKYEKEYRENIQAKGILTIFVEDACCFNDMLESVYKLHKKDDENCRNCQVKYPCKTIKVILNAERKYERKLEKNAKENT